MAEQQELKTYRGNCHCGAYIYEVKLPEIKTASDCNCSHCSKKGLVWQYPKPSDLTWVKGDPETLTDYRFGSKGFGHKFCGNCGTPLLCSGHMTPPQPGEEKDPMIGLNIRAIQDLDLWGLEITTMDGKSFGAPYEAPEYSVPDPDAEVEGGKIYTGSCHCGAVTLKAKLKPLDKTNTEKVMECNCSTCHRNGVMWMYPKLAQVVVQGEENLTYYQTQKAVFLKSFCKTCGSTLDNQPKDFTAEELAKLPEGARSWVAKAGTSRNLNIRLLDGVDLKELKTERFDGFNIIKPVYVNP